MEEVEEYCRNKSAPDGSNLYYATLYESATNKHLIFSLFALHYELINCLSSSPDTGVIRIKYHWWHEEIDRLSLGNPRHPVTTALLPLIEINPFIIDYIRQHYSYIDTLLNNHKSNTLDDWKIHHYYGSGGLWECIEKSTSGLKKNPSIINNGGIIFTLDIIQNISQLLLVVPDFFPASLLEKHKIKSLKDTQNKAGVSDMFNEIIMEFESELNKIYSAITREKVKPAIYSMIMNKITSVVCKEIRHDNNKIMHHKIAITPLRKLWISWRIKITY
ncbi:MAG: phytoene synthase [Gammaproteobacteria bacterium]|jgi:phytoene synthase